MIRCGRTNELQRNNMTSTKPTQLQPNQLQGTPIKATAINEENQLVIISIIATRGKAYER